jgi:hypothetical protein
MGGLGREYMVCERVDSCPGGSPMKPACGRGRSIILSEGLGLQRSQKSVGDLDTLLQDGAMRPL